MTTTIEGIYRNGIVELRGKTRARDGAKVSVTFLPAPGADDTGADDWPEGFLQRFAGALADAPIAREDQGGYETREGLR
jgi:hypothetical protein